MPWAFLHPDGGGRPQVADFGGLAEARHRVRREREQTVDRVLNLGIAEHVHQLDRFFHLLVEVVGRERHLGRAERRFLVRGDVVGVVQDRTVGIRAHFHRARRLPFVTECVHVANDRVADLALCFGKHVHRADVSHLVHGGHERDRCAGHVRDPVRPDTARNNDVFGLDPTLVGDDGRDLLETGAGLILSLDVKHFGVGEHLEPSLVDGLVAEQSAGVERVDDTDCRAVEAAEDHIVVDERDELFDLCWRQQLGVDAPCFRRRHTTIKLVHPLLRPGDLDATRVDAALDIPVLVGALHTEQRHLLVVIDREDEV